MSHNGKSGRWIPDIDYVVYNQALMLVPNLYIQIDLLENKIGLLNNTIASYKSIADNKEIRKWKFQAIGFRISTEILAISFVSSLTFLFLYMGWNYLKTL